MSTSIKMSKSAIDILAQCEESSWWDAGRPTSEQTAALAAAGILDDADAGHIVAILNRATTRIVLEHEVERVLLLRWADYWLDMTRTASREEYPGPRQAGALRRIVEALNEAVVA